MKIANVSYSLSTQPATLSEWQTHLIDEIGNFIDGGAEVILYPELFLMGLTDYFQGDLISQMKEISGFVWTKLLPEIKKVISEKNIVVCLGSGPRVVSDKIFNSAPIFINGDWQFQDKLHLTPWETDFIGGTELKIFTFKNLKLATVICFDVEQPGLALKLKEKGIHILLVPSATTDRNGSHRVNRCANARSVELGAVVITSPLIGDSACDLVDHNEGRQGFFLPAQAVAMVEQEQYSSYSADKKVVHSFEVAENLLVELKRQDSETKPYLQRDNHSIILLDK